MADEGFNKKNSEWWTTIAGRKIYAKSLEALYRTVAYGWKSGKASKGYDNEEVSFSCLYCGRESYVISNPCPCLFLKGDMGKRLMAMKKLNDLMNAEKVKQKKEVKKPSIIVP